MAGRHEFNPHFHPTLPSEPPHEVSQPDPTRRPTLPSEPPHEVSQPDPTRRGRRQSRTQRQYPQPIPTPTPHSPPPHQPQTPPPHQRSEDHYPLHPQIPPPHHGSEDHYPLHPLPLHPTQPPRHSTQPPTQPPRHSVQPPRHPTQAPRHPTQAPRHSVQPPTQPPRHSTQPSPVHPTHPSSNVRIHRRKTGPHIWLIGVFCALFWAAIFLGGLIVLIVYLLFRPRGPKFDIAAASLNAAYLDMGYLLNADMTLLAKFTNPSKKATVDFHYMYLKLYFGNTVISTTYVEPFKAMKTESAFRNVHLVSSQVGLPFGDRQRMAQQIEGNRIRFEVKGWMRTRSNLGSFFRYSYWLYVHCSIEVTGPPSGVLVGKQCTTKR